MKRATAPIAFGTLLSLLICSLAFLPSTASAHEFSGDESATFISKIEEIRVHLGLILRNIAADDTRLAAEHADHAAGLLTDDMVSEIAEKNRRIASDLPAALSGLQDALAVQGPPNIGTNVQDAQGLLDEAISARVDRDQLTNSTVKALVIANLADKVLAQYGAAFGAEGDGRGSSSNNNATMTSAGAGEVVDLGALQTAQALAARMQELSGEIDTPAGPDAAAAFDAARSGIDRLASAVGQEEPLDDVTEIVHGQVHENLRKAFNLAPSGPTTGEGEPITFNGTSTGGKYNVTVVWTPADIGSESEFRLDFKPASGEGEQFVVTYDIMLLKDGEHLDETHRGGQEALVQYYTFDEPGSYTLRMENINNDPGETFEVPMQVVPEFPAGALVLAAAIAGVVAFAGRRLLLVREMY